MTVLDMKKIISLIIVAIMLVSLIGCAEQSGDDKSGRPISAYIGEDVTKIEITHIIGGVETKWTAEGEQVNSIREWANGLRYEILEVEQGNTPGDRNGGEIYRFVLTEGDYPGFSYVISGGYYLMIEGHWYTVTNPSNPPFDAIQTN